MFRPLSNKEFYGSTTAMTRTHSNSPFIGANRIRKSKTKEFNTQYARCESSVAFLESRQSVFLAGLQKIYFVFTQTHVVE